MARVEGTGTPPEPALTAIRRRARRSAGAVPQSSRAVLGVLCALAIIEAPDTWMRAVIAVPTILIVYLGGKADGRRDYAIELLRRGDRGPTRAPVREGEPEEG